VFPEGRRGFAWFGVATFAVGLIAWFPVLRYLRDNDAQGWTWLILGVGMIPALVVIVAAGRPTSWTSGAGKQGP